MLWCVIHESIITQSSSPQTSCAPQQTTVWVGGAPLLVGCTPWCPRPLGTAAAAADAVAVLVVAAAPVLAAGTSECSAVHVVAVVVVAAAVAAGLGAAAVAVWCWAVQTAVVDVTVAAALGAFRPVSPAQHSTQQHKEDERKKERDQLYME